MEYLSIYELLDDATIKTQYIELLSYLTNTEDLLLLDFNDKIKKIHNMGLIIVCITRIHDEIKLIGLIAVYINEDENLCFVSNVSVIHGFSGKGIATTLFYRTQNLIKNLRVDTMILHVDKNNYPAINFYEKLGFQHDLIFDNKIKMILYLK